MTGQDSVTIVLADDHAIVRSGLRALLETQPGLQVVGEASNGIETAKLVERVQPRVLVLDLMMSGMNGLEVTRQLSKHVPDTSIIILSMYNDEGYVLKALQAGAKAYVLKESTSDELVRAIHEVCAGRRYLGSPLSERAIDTYLQKTRSNILDPYDTLTTREREVLHLAAQGSTNAEIATKLFISRRTVEVHRTNMMQKLGLHTQTDLVRWALQKGILPTNEPPPK